MSTNPHEAQAQREKAIMLVSVILADALASGEDVWSSAFRERLAQAGPSFWEAAADKVTAARRANGDSRECHPPSEETCRMVIAFFERVTQNNERLVR